MYSIAFRHHLNLVDIRWSGLFDQPSVDAYADELIRRFRVTTSAITRLQVRRFITQPYLRIFDSTDAALDWLVASGEAALAS